MTFAAPAFLAAGALAALAIVVLHFLARQRPRAAPFPTARFIPERTARAPSRALQPTDLLLLLLRALTVVLLGAAFARPALEGARKGTRRIVLADRSRAAASMAEVRDSALAALRPGDALVLFDSAGRIVRDGAPDSLHALALSRAAGAISAALAMAQQAAADLAAGADSVELVLVSPIAREEMDAATLAIRGEWPGAIRVARVAIAPTVEPRGIVTIRGAADDPLRTAGLGARRSTIDARVVRDAERPADSVWAADSGGVLVRWPAVVGAGDTAQALVAANDVVVAPFARGAALPTGAAVAWWADGHVAAAERRTRTGCVRDVSVGVPAAGDLVLRESFRRAFDALIAPCGGARDARPVSDSVMALLRGPGALAPARAWSRASDSPPPMSGWLLLGAAALLIAEPLLRRRAE